MTRDLGIMLAEAVAYVGNGGVEIDRADLLLHLKRGQITCIAEIYFLKNTDTDAEIERAFNVPLDPGAWISSADTSKTNCFINWDGSWLMWMSQRVLYVAQGIYLLKADIERAFAVSPSFEDVPIVGKRGPKPDQFNRVIAEMRGYPLSELASMTEEAMKSIFNASRETCRKARIKIRSEFQ